MYVRLIAYGEQMKADDIATNIALARHGADNVEKMCISGSRQQLQLLTHCNTGSLATAGYGTALGLILSSHLFTSVVVLEESPCPRGSLKTNLQVLVLVLGSQVLVLVLKP